MPDELPADRKPFQHTGRGGGPQRSHASGRMRLHRSGHAGLSVFWEGGDTCYHVPVWHASSDGDGAVLTDVPAGRVRILRAPEDVSPMMTRRWHDPRVWPLVEEVVVRAGEETIVELPR